MAPLKLVGTLSICEADAVFPRQESRGPIEASAGIVLTILNLSSKFPRQESRGPIEATNTRAEVPRISDFHGKKVVAPLKPAPTHRKDLWPHHLHG